MLIEQMYLIHEWLFEWKFFFYFETLMIFKFLKTCLDYL